MNRMLKIIGISVIFVFMVSCAEKGNGVLKYTVNHINKEFNIDANWSKSPWNFTKAINIDKNSWEKPKYMPEAQAKMLYSDSAIFVIFRAKERFVRSTIQKINGPTYRDSAIEFFFTPGSDINKGYFNLEINCGGFPYMGFQKGFKKEFKQIDELDIRKIKIAHSLPPVIKKEIKETTTWVIEFRIPISILEKYTKVTKPGPGVIWRANFYKTADTTTNPHYLSWSKIESSSPNFHLPKFFGYLIFN